MNAKDIIIIFIMYVSVVTIGYMYGNRNKTEIAICKTITQYETRQCTIYSDGTEECTVVGRG